ncbi:MAG: hypothetical protein FD170_185 [Bacteroidetes bacterium]|nr:MAG: hypothetical protein FD170_185 [Bacteroidota bacterium]
MIKRMINKQRMQIAVMDFLEKNETKLLFAPALAGYVDILQDTLAHINTMQQAQLTSSEGHTQTKDALKQKVIDGLLEIVKRVKAYAIVTDDKILQEAVKYSYTNLQRLPQTSIVGAVNRVLDAARPKLADIAPYGLSPEMVENVEQDLQAYVAALPGTKRVIAYRKTATGELDNLFTAADSSLKKIDALMDIVSNADPLFYQEYKNLRMVDDLKRKSNGNGSGKTGISGTVANLETGLNQPGVRVSIVGTNQSTLTDAEGNYTLPLSEAGSYSIKAELKGYADYEEDEIEVESGVITDVDFDMEPLS